MQHMFKDYYNWNFKDGNNRNNGLLYEFWVKSILRLLGIEAETTGRDDDKGVDIVAQATVEKKTKFYIQCKCWSEEVGTSPIQEIFTGCSLRGNDGHPVVITNNHVTLGARKIARDLGVEVIARPEWELLQQSWENNKVINKKCYGLLGIMMGSITMDYDHIKESERHPYTPKIKQLGNLTTLEMYKYKIEASLDDALLYEQEASKFEQRASILRQASLKIQKEAILKNFDYG